MGVSVSFLRRLLGSGDEPDKSPESNKATSNPPEANPTTTKKSATTDQDNEIPQELVMAETPDELESPTLTGVRATPSISDTVRTAPLPPEPDLPVPSVIDGVTRKLAADKVVSFTNAHITFGIATDVGMVRQKNEDSSFSLFASSRSIDNIPDFGLFIVADGMGGHSEGEKASAIAVRVISNTVLSTIYLGILNGKSLADMPPMSDILVDAMQKANEEVSKAIPKGGGTTCTVVTILGDRAHLSHVGDSRAYLVTKDDIEQLTRDHSVRQRLIEMGQIEPDEPASQMESALYRALGFNEEVEFDVLSRRLPPHSRLLMCSDGLWNLVEKQDIHTIVMGSPNAQEACNKLIALANERGGHDNITVIVLFR